VAIVALPSTLAAPAAGDWNRISLPSEIVDVGNSYADGVFTAPIAGIYQVDASAYWLKGTATSFELGVTRSAAAVENAPELLLHAQAGAPNTILAFTESTSGLVKLAAGDRIALAVQWLSGGATNPQLLGSSTRLSIAWVANG
jgi:hypothetical protein